jgi:hypothetical protein
VDRSSDARERDRSRRPSTQHWRTHACPPCPARPRDRGRPCRPGAARVRERRDVQALRSTKDVQSFHDTSGATAQPTNKTADISHLTVRHTSQRLTVTVKLRDLAKTWYVVSELETPDGLTGSRDKDEAHDHVRHSDLLPQLPALGQGGRRRGRRIVDDVRRRRPARRRSRGREQPRPEQEDPPGLSALGARKRLVPPPSGCDRLGA